MSPAESERDRIRATRDHHVGRLFLQAHRAYSGHAIALLRARGYGELSAAHAAILPHIDLEGTRVTAIAERAGMTKQGAGHVIDDLERQGLVVRVSDPADRRAARVQFTDAGWAYLRAAAELKHETEAEYAQLLGADAFLALCTNLERVIDYERTRSAGAPEPGSAEKR